jgi:hypothetical protein
MSIAIDSTNSAVLPLILLFIQLVLTINCPDIMAFAAVAKNVTLLEIPLILLLIPLILLLIIPLE